MIRILLWIFCLIASSLPAQASELEYSDFARIPVQYEGRLQPLDSFARTLLKMISGGESLESMSAEAWLAESLFDPAQALQRPVFRLFRPQILGLSEREGRHYSYSEIAPALLERSALIQSLNEKDDSSLSEDHKELLRINYAATAYVQLLRSFSLILPLNIAPPAFLKVTEEKPFTLEEYRRYKKSLEDRLKNIVKKKGSDPRNYSEDEMHIADFAFKMQIFEQSGEGNNFLRILPGQSSEWFSPWAIGESGEGSPETAAYLDLWKSMAYAYLDFNASAWKSASLQTAQRGAELAPDAALRLEVLYNQSHALTLAHLCYFLTLLFLIFGTLKPQRYTATFAAGLTFTGLLFHLFAISARVIILDRPPVGTLYESILFVALICSTVGLVMAFLRKETFPILYGTGIAVLLLFVAQGFSQDNTMPVLVAVLNTNFWLATHVLCITTGYAWCLMTALFAHAWLYKASRGHDPSALEQSLKTLALTSLLFTAIGTILGGIWADQSWGRFWGWDPKENGALLIVLWLIWVLHGQISGHMNKSLSAALLAALSVVVALAWFGVNLLNTGLHSYGFITGVAAALGSFCLLECLVIGWLFYQAYKRGRPSDA